MLLNYEEITNLALLQNAEANNYENASYNLRIGAIINSQGKSVNDYVLPPHGMIMVVSKESFALPDNIVGYTTVKNRLSISGVLAINIGIVDSGYKGPISSVLINFGKESFDVNLNETFMRMTFHKFTQPTTLRALSARNQYTDFNHYTDERKKDAKILGDKFLYLDDEVKKYEDQTVSGVKGYFFKIGTYITVAIGVIGILLAAIPYAYSTFSEDAILRKFKSSKLIDSTFKKQDSVIKQYKIIISKQDSLIKHTVHDLDSIKHVKVMSNPKIYAHKKK
ncbi:MAG: dCTP deaminase domain-containing protein [Sphingobacteriales bacterium]